MARLLLVGLNHTTAPLEVREKLAFAGGQRRVALEAFRARYPEAEAVLVSTCNRVELYVARGVHGQPREEGMAEFLADFHSISAAEVAPHLYRKADRAAIEHLFAVTSSLDSLVLGEAQILGQVREAYDIAAGAHAAGPTLHPLFQRALAVGKAVRARTALGEGHLSVASVAVDYARRIFDHFGDKTVLCIGAGKMATLVLRSFVQLSAGKLLVCNRDPAKAASLAVQFGGAAVPFERLTDHLAQADVVITSTGSAHPILTRSMFEAALRKRRYRPVFVIDIALPRDVEASAAGLEDLYLYNIDDLQQVVAQTHQQRAGAVDEARKIVAEAVEEFVTWERQRRMGPLIDRLYKRYHGIARQEVERTAAKLGEEERQRLAGHLEELARRIVNKLLHEPVQGLRDGDVSHGSAMHYMNAVERLFRLDREEGPASGGGTNGSAAPATPAAPAASAASAASAALEGEPREPAHRQE